MWVAQLYKVGQILLNKTYAEEQGVIFALENELNRALVEKEYCFKKRQRNIN